MGLFIKKPFSMLQAEANESGAKTLKRVLGAWSLVALDRKSTRLNSSHNNQSRMPSSA